MSYHVYFFFYFTICVGVTHTNIFFYFIFCVGLTHSNILNYFFMVSAKLIHDFNLASK